MLIIIRDKNCQQITMELSVKEIPDVIRVMGINFCNDSDSIEEYDSNSKIIPVFTQVDTYELTGEDAVQIATRMIILDFAGMKKV